MFVTVCINPVLDLLFQIPATSFERRQLFESAELRGGGFGPNAARALRCRGDQVLCLVVAGGGTGKLLESALVQEGLRFESLPGKAATRTAVHELLGAESRMLVSPSPRIGPRALGGFFDRALEITGPQDWLLVGGSAPAGAEELYIERVCDLARHRSCCLDIRTDRWPALAAAGPRVLKLPSQAASKSRAEALAAARRACEMGASLALASAPARELFAADKTGAMRVVAPRVPTVNPFGAGDCLIANLAAHLYADTVVSDALQQAVAAAAVSVSSPVPGDFEPERAARLAQSIRVEPTGL